MRPPISPLELAQDLPRLRRAVRRHCPLFDSDAADDVLGELVLELVSRARRSPRKRYHCAVLLRLALLEATRLEAWKSGRRPGVIFISIDARREALAHTASGLGAEVPELAVPPNHSDREESLERLRSEAVSDALEEFAA